MPTIYITGASAGLGRAIAQACGQAGHTLGLIARDGDALQQALQESGGKGATATADVADFAALDRAAETLIAQIGPPDVWINCAMATIFARFADIAPEEFARSIGVTLLGSVHGMRIALKHMKPRGHGHIVQIGSALSYRAIPLQAPYCASKYAIRAVCDSLRCELIHDKSPVTVAMVQMPAMNTPQFDWARRHIAEDPQPVPPIYAPEACAKAVLWAVDHPHMREVWVGKPTFQAILGNKLIPALLDRYMAKRAFEGQFEKPASTRDKKGNLFETVPALHSLKGHFTAREIPSVLWIGTSEKREWAMIVAAVLILVLLILMII